MYVRRTEVHLKELKIERSACNLTQSRRGLPLGTVDDRAYTRSLVLGCNGLIDV